ncbi:sigma-54-dependent Fis family transcriptional regulator [Sporosarcina sp. P37]|uniref:sigma-54 interaction domain-containing protein n=1 Tax=unclassified Sporosarcina TaxID=2647733 RepID=UPI000A17A7A0|nr:MULTISPECIES: sigma 54-interacting transcriptional regulator [unclassified Sporosarcina]ARK24845.1 sigma-54-dependent Fis family transcriptional regulator [Sporosarcina sp. P37]
MLKYVHHFITDIMKKDFLILDENTNEEIIKEHMASSPSAQLFIRHSQHYRQIRLQDDGLFYENAPILSIDIPASEMSKKFACADLLLCRDPRGEITGYIEAERFIDKLIEEHEKTLAYLQTVLHTIDESCTVIDQDANVLYWTKGAESLFSLKEEDVIGKPITDFFDTKHLEILHTLQDGSSVRHSQHHARRDLVVLINSNPIYHRNRIIGAVVSETDITSQIRMNDELYATSEKLFLLEEEVRKSAASHNPFDYIKGNSDKLKQTMEITKKAASTDASILLHGESGVGKELFAKAIHNLREPQNAPFVAINCGAIPESLFESEIFGYEKGAFSGADQRGKKGKIELARGGTLLLDEVGEMPLDMQVKFLRVLQERKYYSVGGTKEIEADFRIVAATNRDLRELVREGTFREDLYYRLNVVNVNIPALRERAGDIIELTHYFLYEFSVKYNRQINSISQAVMQALLQHSWPGNIRELRNTIERLVVFSDNGVVNVQDLPPEIMDHTHPLPVNSTSKTVQTESAPFAEQVKDFERKLIVQELEKANGNKLQCAKNLEITRATLYNKMHKLDIPF